jgi:hypothetical protein
MSYDRFARGPAPWASVPSLSPIPRAADARCPSSSGTPPPPHGGADLDAATQDTYEVVPGFPPVTQDAVRDAARGPSRTLS